MNNGASWDNFCGAAEMALEAMKFPDAPKLPIPTTSSEALIAWQKWAIAKGFVPKNWSSRVGAPAWLLGEEANERIGPRSVAAKSPQQTQPLGSPLSATANSPVPSNSPPHSVSLSAVESKAFGHVYRILLAVVLILLIIGGIFAWKRNS